MRRLTMLWLETGGQVRVPNGRRHEERCRRQPRIAEWTRRGIGQEIIAQRLGVLVRTVGCNLHVALDFFK